MENKDKIIELLDDAGLFPINPSFFDVISMASDRRVKTEVKLKAHRKNMLGEIADLINALYTEPVSERQIEWDADTYADNHIGVDIAPALWIEAKAGYIAGANTLYTEPVSEEAMMTKAKEFLNGDTPDIQKGVKTMRWAAYRMAKFALYMQQRQVKQISEKRIEEIAEYLINSVQKAENHNFTGNLDKYYKGCIDGIKAALKELNNG